MAELEDDTAFSLLQPADVEERRRPRELRPRVKKPSRGKKQDVNAHFEKLLDRFNKSAGELMLPARRKLVALFVERLMCSPYREQVQRGVEATGTYRIEKIFR